MTQAAKLAQLGSPGISTGFKNRIINGAMVISQRGTSFTGLTNGSGQYTLDRFRWSESGAFTGVQTVTQDSSAPAGFTNSLKVQTTTAVASLASTESCRIDCAIEGYNVADFGWGTANAATVTLSFWVRSSLTGTFGGAFRNSVVDRSYPFTYTINSADTWEQKSITVVGETTGTWGTTNNTGMIIVFGLGVGSTYSGTAGAWASADYQSATGAVSVVGTLNATWYITGVQLEVGTTATDFEYRDYGRELIMCQRYCQTSFSNATSLYQRYASGQIITGSTAEVYFQLKATMRTTPSLTTTGTSGNYVIYSGNTVYSLSGLPSVTTAISNNEFVGSQIATTGGMTGGYAGSLNSNNLSNTYIWLTAEL